MERIKMSELPKALSVKGEDNVLILQDGSTKTTTMDLIAKNIKGQPGETGAQGPVGPAGKNGVDGKQIELKKGETHIEWQYAGTDSWQQLIALTELKGPKGDAGAQGATGPAADLQSYQKKDDETLTTTAKTIVGAINELVTKYTELQSKYTQLEQKIAQHHPE